MTILISAQYNNRTCSMIVVNQEMLMQNATQNDSKI